MITTLLQVALLTMGVGAKASTPVCLKEQPQTLKQEKQRLEQNETPISFTTTFNNQNQANQAAKEVTTVNNIYRDWNIQQNASYTMQLKKHASAEIETERDSYDHYKYVYETQYQNPHNWNDEMYIMSLNGTYATSDIQLAFNFKDCFEYDIEDQGFNGYTVKQINIVQTTNQATEFTQEMAYTVANYGTPKIQYRDFLNNRFGNNYTETNYTIEHSISDEDYTINHSLTLTPKVTNWIFIFIFTYIVYDYPLEWDRNTDDIIYSYVYNWRSLTARYYEATKLNSLTISGSYIQVTAEYEVVDIPGLMWEILTMPFAFISQAFNLTLFPNTPYQLNVSNLILTIFGALVFLWFFGMLRKRL